MTMQETPAGADGCADGADARAQALAQARALLAQPPWLRKAQQPKLPVLDVAALPTEERITWPAGELEWVLARAPLIAEWAQGRGLTHGYPTLFGIQPAGAERLQRGEALQPGDAVPWGVRPVASAELLLLAPEASRLLIWNSLPVEHWSNNGRHQDAMDLMLATFGTAALPGLIAYAHHFPLDGGIYMARRADSPQLVDLMLHAGLNLKHPGHRGRGRHWLRQNARTVLFHQLPQAFVAANGKARDAARRGIRWLTTQGFTPLLREVAQAYGPAMVEAAEALLAQDPLLALPARMPTLPAFFQPERLRLPRLLDGEPLTAGAAQTIASMLAICKPDEPYAGLDVLRAACVPASLADFAVDLFQCWLAAGAPAKENWAYTALGLLGDDDSARVLAPLILKWPSEGASARAVLGVDLLAAIGSDVALMHLDAIASKAKTPALKDKARVKIQAIADARALTPEQLSDRLVPRLGLDAEGASVLDFGPRHFVLQFDETLQPCVRDASGKRLKDLPKPLKTDDAVLAEETTRRFKQVKKDAKLIASRQVARMERAMVDARRWSATEFHALFLQHPVMRHLAARLAWGVYGDGALQDCFRVAEDWTLADAGDRPFTLAADAVVGIPHPVELPALSLQALQALFADYEVLQPFKQLARETFALTPEEAASDVLTRFQSRVLVTAGVLGLATRGWQPTGGDSGGWISELARPAGELRVEFRMEPGTIVGNPLHEPRQRIPAVRVGGASARPTFGELGAVQASEVLRDFELLPLAPA
jgi:hypothetical protein